MGGALGGAVPLLVYLSARNAWRTERGLAELTALVNVRPLAGSMPLDLGGWAADPVLMDLVLRLVSKRDSDLIVECGSGWSTVLLSRFLAQLGHGRLLAIEHDERFAERTLSLVSQYGAPDHVELVRAPLRKRTVGEEQRLWYGHEVEAALEGWGRINLLLVDGPPGGAADKSRYPAIPVLGSYLTESSLIVLDDGFRSDEAWTARAWGRQLQVEPEFIPSGLGVWVLDLGQRPARGSRIADRTDRHESS